MRARIRRRAVSEAKAIGNLAGFKAARGMGDGPLNTHATLYALKVVLSTDDMPAFERALDGHVP